MRVREKFIGSVLWILLPWVCYAAEKEALYRWRTAVERIYEDGRLGAKKPFDEVMPPASIQRLVDADLHKEEVLKRDFGVEITSQMIAEDSQRINQSSQAPETLAKIKAALGPDEAGFAETVVKPILVERLLRQKYYQDKTIHAAERASASDQRRRLQAGERLQNATELVWLLAARPKDAAEAAGSAPKFQPSQIKSASGVYSNEATAQVAEVLGGTEADDSKNKERYFDDINPELREVLKTQLRKSGDVSSVIETPEGFSIYRAKELTATHWKVEAVFIARKSYDAWLATR